MVFCCVETLHALSRHHVVEREGVLDWLARPAIRFNEKQAYAWCPYNLSVTLLSWERKLPRARSESDLLPRKRIHSCFALSESQACLESIPSCSRALVVSIVMSREGPSYGQHGYKGCRCRAGPVHRLWQ